jgi:ketosteroid isomerase-like protein
MKGLITVLAVLVVVGLAFFLYRTPTAPPEMTEAERAQYEAEVREDVASRAEEYADATLSGDLDAGIDMFTSDARVYWPGVNMSRDELQAFFQEFSSTASWTECDLEEQEFFMDGDTPYTIYQYSETYQIPEQEPVSNVYNCFTRWEMEDGVWKIDREVCGARDVPE